ncbi:polysaccharide biosynthesis/export family protein [Planctomycetota bacterium]
MRYIRILARVVLMAFLVSLTGCFSSNPEDIQAFAKPQKVIVTADNYILQPPDEIDVFCSKAPEINLQRQRIRPDGKVSFESIGEVQAAGLTPAQLADALEKKIRSLYNIVGDKPIDVRVVAFNSAFYYVLGQVSFSGPKLYTGRDTVLHAVADARPTILAWKERIQVIRPSSDRDTDTKIFEVNWDRLMAHGDTSKDVLLEEGDIIYVPPTILAWISMRVEEALRPVGRIFSTVTITQRGTTGGVGGGYGGGYGGR